MSYRIVLFDLFDTLVLFERERMPEVRVNGRVVRSTAGHLHQAFQTFAPGVDLGTFFDALLGSWKEAERIRDETHREVPAPERFGMLFRRLGLEPSMVPPEILERLLHTHMTELSKAVVCPEHHPAVLGAVGQGRRLGVVSNFDYTPTARLILERERLSRLFETVVVSDEIGWRKPKAVIFETALRRLGAAAEETLFVGDRADIDVAGAQAVGMATAWINRDRAALPEGAAAPDFEIRDLRELETILGR
ncbi:MAG TPA: HAD family hydrolase [Methylomirabilota bacterium]|nr:HAD family hydrolase [Methylomirabilota bacterium]